MTLPSEAGSTITCDAFLGGRLKLHQPERGHRAGLDAMLLAAACPAKPGDHVADLGAGVGAAALAVLARVPSATATLVEREPLLADLAARNGVENGLADQIRIVRASIGQRGGIETAGLDAGSMDHVIANPPFANVGQGRNSPDALKRAAHELDAAGLEPWFRWASALLVEGGSFTLIHEPKALPSLLSLCGYRFGGTRILPVHPREGLAASRVVVQMRRGSNAGLTICPGLVLHPEDGNGYTPQAEGILRNAEPLPIWLA